MAKQSINVGATANDKKGDSLRAAFQKVNANFTELYTALGLAADANLNLGAFEFTGSTMSTTDSTAITIDQATTITSNLTVGGDILPQTANGGNLGSLDKPFKSLYVSDQTVFFGGVPLSLDPATNELQINNVPVSQTITYADIPNVPTDIADLTDTGNLLGSGGSLTVGNGNSTSVENVTELLINGTITEIEPGVVGVTIAGGTTQPYLELTDTPFITQSAILGEPVTVTAAPWSHNARFTVGIEEGTPLGFSITITTPGTGYVVGQQYRLWGYYLGGPDVAGSIDFTVDTVGEDGELLTITDAAFAEGADAATNTPGTYTNVEPRYLPSVFDEIDTGLTLTRGRIRGIFNIAAEAEYNNNNYTSPLGTEWNSEGWGDLLQLGTRNYGTWRDALGGSVGNNIIGAELVMHDTINDKYYKFEFTNWGGEDGGFSYTRTLVEDPNYFKKDDYATANNVDVIEDDSTLQIGITRGNNQGIYNPFTEEGWDGDVSPQGTLWNIDGWNDLTNLTDRTYTNLDAAFGGNQLGNKIVGTECVMYVPSIEKYYAIKFLGWTQNNNGGGFSYVRYEIDLDKLQEGIIFADGTRQTTAYIDTNVVSTAPGQRRIETASGYNQVSVTQRLTDNYTGAVSQTTNGYELRVARTSELDAVIIPLNEGGLDVLYTLSFDNVNFREVWLSSIQQNEYWFYYQEDFGQTTPQTEDDPVYLRITSGGDSVAWWDKSNLPGGSGNFRGAVINYHAFTGQATWIGTIHIADDDGDEYITHTEVSSADNDDSMNDNLWIVTDEGTIRYARFDGDARTLKIQWTATVFYGSEYSND
jgi:hypothetical protein